VRKPLYGKPEAEALAERERALWRRENSGKFAVLAPHLAGCRRAVDLGCGWGQFLRFAADRVPELWGVDESPDRIADCRDVCPQARLVQCRADALDLPDDYFDVLLTSQMLHEVKLFSEAGELDRVLAEIRRVLRPGGRYLLLDHADAGDGSVAVRLPDPTLALLAEFEAKFAFRPARHEDLGNGVVRTERRTLQDFLTKTWAFGNAMEEMEMNETHNAFGRREATAMLEEAGFQVRARESFADISVELHELGGRFVAGRPWFRKLLIVAVKP